MSNIIISRINLDESINDSQAGIHCVKHVGGFTYIQHHYSAKFVRNGITRDIDAYGIKNLPYDILAFISNTTRRIYSNLP